MREPVEGAPSVLAGALTPSARAEGAAAPRPWCSSAVHVTSRTAPRAGRRAAPLHSTRCGSTRGRVPAHLHAQQMGLDLLQGLCRPQLRLQDGADGRGALAGASLQDRQ